MIALEGPAVWLTQQVIGMLVAVMVWMGPLSAMICLYISTGFSTCNTYYNILRKILFSFCQFVKLV